MKAAALSFDVIWAHHGDKPELYRALEAFASERIWGRAKVMGDGMAMAVAESGSILAVMVFYDYDEDAGVMQISGATDSPRWLNKHTLWELFNYPFNVAKCQTVVMRVDPADKRLGRMLPAYGFKRFDIPRLRGRDKDEALYVLHDDVWRANRFHSEN